MRGEGDREWLQVFTTASQINGCASEPESMDVPEEAEEDSVVTVFVDDVHVALQEEIDGPRSSWMLAGEIGRAHRRNNRQGVKDCRKVVHADT